MQYDLIFFDTETTGLPPKKGVSFRNTDEWPRLVQISWVVCDETRDKYISKTFTVKPIGFTIPEEAVNVHGITTEKAIAEGSQLEDVLDEFIDDIDICDAVVGHNIQYDVNVVLAELHRYGMDTKFLEKLPQIDTMLIGTNVCKIPSAKGYRYPKLLELYTRLFHKSFDYLHSANADVNATYECFWTLYDMNLVSKEDQYDFFLTEEEKLKLSKRYFKEANNPKDYDWPLMEKAADYGNVDAKFIIAKSWINDDHELKVGIRWYKEAFDDLLNSTGILLAEKDETIEEHAPIYIKALKGLGLMDSAREIEVIHSKIIEKKRKNLYEELTKDELGISRLLDFYRARWYFEKSDEHKLWEKYLVKSEEEELKIICLAYHKGFANFDMDYADKILYPKDKTKYFKFLKNYDIKKPRYKDAVIRLSKCYLNGYGTEVDIKKAIDLIARKGIKADFCHFLIPVFMGEYGNEYIDYDKAITILHTLGDWNSDKYAKIADAYVAKKEYSKAKEYYAKVKDIDNYKSTYRSEFLAREKRKDIIEGILWLLAFIGFCFIIYLLVKK